MSPSNYSISLSDLRERLSEAQNHRCCWCGCDLRIHAASIEHIVPIFFGGTHDADNLAVACSTCNTLRGALEQFRVLIATGRVKMTNRKKRRFAEWLQAFGDENFKFSNSLSECRVRYSQQRHSRLCKSVESQCHKIQQ